MAGYCNKDHVQHETTADKLELLFSHGEICATEIHCLNDKSKESIDEMKHADSLIERILLRATESAGSG